MTEKNPTLYISDDKLGHFAENSAKMLELSKSVNAKGVTMSIAENLRRIRSAVKLSEAFATEGNRMPKPAEWLTDNWYIAEREGKGAIRDLKNIKQTRAAGQGGSPLILYAAEELVRSGAGEVTRERIMIFLEGFQKAVVLRERELAIFMPSLKAALVAELSMTAARTEEFLKDKVNIKDEKRLREEHILAAAAERVISSLRLLSSIDVTKILERVNKTEQILQEDPAGIYPLMDERTRIYYRRKVSELSRKTKLEEYKIAKIILELAEEGEGKASHVGYFIFVRPLGKMGKKRSGSTYISIIILTTLFISLLLGFMLNSAVVAALLLLPISEIVKNVTDFFVIKAFPPRQTPKLELKDGIPEEAKTLCIISALLTSDDVCMEYPRLLEEYCLSNRDSGKNLLFGILADLPESNEEFSDKDSRRLQLIKDEIEKLNKKYGGFYLFTRGRVYSENNGRYMGWERKRGAILELVRLLSGAESHLRVASGDSPNVSGVKYIITLDSDTRLGVGTARELVGAMLHPLGKAEIDMQNGIVTAGHAILQPRVSVDLKAANRSDFTRLFAGQGGIDPYGNAAGDVYNDIFDEGSFMGKGIIDVAAFFYCLNNRLPENLILSHDLLEGAYLRAGFAGDVELTDGYPYKTSSYFERLHRWTRGDWQIIGWLFSNVPGEKGRVKNPINQVNKWKIFDNLRRSTVPIATFAALYIAMLTRGLNFAAAAAVAILSAMSSLLISSAELMFRRDINTKARYHSTIISGFGAALTQTLVQLIFLPYHAYVCLHAVITAIYRMTVSRKNLLSWVTAAESDRKKGDGLLSYFQSMYAPVILGALAIMLSRRAVGSAVGIIWFISPVCAVSLSKEKKHRQILSVDDRLFLVRSANEIWRYFVELSNAENNYLPPDNFQEQPPVGAAERTSPTNIGLALLSALAAMDMGLSGADKAPELIEKIITTVEKLPKWNGHLYNWYDTQTLRPLEPCYVSAVDSGNLAGSLIALREGLLEKGEEFKSLAERVDKLNNAMDFSPMFDRDRQLFYIGLEASGEPTEGWYDLMASEARQTSYIAIAKGFVSKKHWRRLGRVLISKDNFCGMASWTGTMFEYLMPNLLMPCYENSMLYESMKFCVYVQKRAFNPWGMSESAFYSFDPNLNYQYKAHGAGCLALKRGQEKECVISPYSSFLALQMVPKSAIKNLKKMSQMGMEGRYGFYEAVDFTPVRQLGNKFEVVKCFMVHHLGMSLVAADNAVNDGVMQKRFMRDREMAAYAELLQEKVPIGQVVLRKPTREIPEKPRIVTWQGWKAEGEGVSLKTPACTLLSNGTYTVALSETGASRSMLRDMSVTRMDSAEPGEYKGMSFYLKTGDEFISLLPQPDFCGETQFSFLFTDRFGEINAKRNEFISKTGVMVSPEYQGELRTVAIRNTQNKSLEAELICYFEPVLAKACDYYAHPAFSKLAFETESENGIVIMKRRPYGRRKSIYASFACDREMSFDTSKEIALGRGGERSLPQALNSEAKSSTGAVLNPCMMARVKLIIKPFEEVQTRFALCVEYSKEKALAVSGNLLKMPSLGGACRVEEAAKSLGANISDIETAMDILRATVFVRENYKERIGIKKATGARDALWKLGISGDIPIVTIIADDEKCADRVKSLLKSHEIMKRSGLRFDMVFITNDGGDYRRPAKTMLTGTLCDLGFENNLGSGIFIADTDNFDEVAAASVKIIDCSDSSEKVQRKPEQLPHSRFMNNALEPVGSISWHYEPDGSFVANLNRALPTVAWSSILTNGRYGYIASDCGAGHMWYKNARENKMNAWLNDVLATEGTERISLSFQGREVSVFAGADGLNCSLRFGFGFAEWVKETENTRIRTTAFIPKNLDARVVIIEAEGEVPEKLIYFTDLIMGAETVQNGIYANKQEDAIIVENKGNVEFPGQKFITACSDGLLSFSDIDGKARTTYCISAEFKASGTMVLISGCDDLEKIQKLLDPEAARDMLLETKAYWESMLSGVKISSPDTALNSYMSGWAMYQALASRYYGRTSMYQNGGAYGFRDQLQDTLCLAQHHPEITRAQILRASEHQFIEGDVQHWWHPNGLENYCDKGVRTNCSDDLLWLPFALCRYCEVTGDLGFPGTEAEYIESHVLNSCEYERYELPHKSGVSESVFEHAKKALDLALSRGTGEHGLNLIGGGDWNDGFDKIGPCGRGESVWLTWFIAYTCERFAHLCENLGKPELSERYTRSAMHCAAGANKAWDGEWFTRAYFDDGTPLGKAGDTECAIDSIAQSFSALTSYSDGNKSRQGIRSAIDMLFDRKNQIVKLFTPPFSGEGKDPGYIRGYVPGVRENGGQYTHAAIWLALGCLRAGFVNEGWEILSALLPEKHDSEIYKAEPFIIAADVYSNPQHIGRSGWNWYTGAAAWYFSVVEEELLGIKIRGGKLSVEPRLPDTWDGYSAVCRTSNAEFHIVVKRTGSLKLLVDGVETENGLLDIDKYKGLHNVAIEIK